jgi:trans-aconitate methyltransferase
MSHPTLEVPNPVTMTDTAAAVPLQQTPAHSEVNRDVLAMMPATAQRIVEVGCMHGALASAFRRAHPQASYVGIDIDPDYARAAAAHCTRAIAADIEKLDDAAYAELFPSDCWVFADCLEHLRDPWAVLRRLRAAIDPGGCLLVCLPNAQHWSVQWRLATGQFRYESSGLLDRTHLRWFTRITMLEMFAQSGWRVDQGLSRRIEAPQQAHLLEAVRAFARAAGGDPEMASQDASAFQYIFRLSPA